MIKGTLIVIIFISIALTPFINFGQVPKSFSLTVNATNEIGDSLFIGEAYFLKNYRCIKFMNDTAVSISGKYTFSGNLLYPTAVRIYGSNSKLEFNELIFIDSGYQDVNLMVKDSKVVILTRPKTKIEYEYSTFLKFIQVKNLNQQISLDLFKLYITQNPKSYVGLFAMIDQTFNYNFSPRLKEIALNFDTAISKTKGFKYFDNQYLSKTKIPEVLLKNSTGNSVNLKFVRNDGKFTLIDFWFAGCTGCFVEMKNIKEKYYTDLASKLRLVSVSTDDIGIVSESIKILNKLKLPWESYWDYKALVFKKITNIYAYPSNLLIDDNGYIIGKDIDIKKIDLFLK